MSSNPPSRNAGNLAEFSTSEQDDNNTGKYDILVC